MGRGTKRLLAAIIIIVVSILASATFIQRAQRKHGEAAGYVGMAAVHHRDR